MFSGDTIAAISSATAPAARCVVRLSGPRALSAAAAVCPSLPQTANAAARVTLGFANLQCPAWVYIFRAPASYTGEDTVELHVPGNLLLAQMLLEALLQQPNVRRAEPGEFTARAFFSGKLDLTAAEGVAAVISAANASQLQAARQLMAGELARQLTPLMDQLASGLALVEAEIDFSDQDVSFLPAEQLQQTASDIDQRLQQLLGSTSRLEQLAHEPRVVLMGRPNAGKSTLLNAVCGQARAVISPVAGTTRDVLSAPLDLPRGRVLLLDVAGVDRQEPTNTIDQQAAEAATRAASAADHLLLVHAADDDTPPLPTPRPPDLIIRTKCELRPLPARADELLVSVHARIGMESLRQALDDLAFARREPARLALAARHVAAVDQARAALQRASAAAAHGAGIELVAADLRQALDELGQVLGHIAPDDVLGRIFSTFCIGK